MIQYIADYEPLVWFYLFSTFVTAVGGGLLFLRFKWIMQDGVGNFLAGFACCPFIQYFWALLLTPFVNGGSRYIFIFSLPAVAIIFIIYLFVKKINALPNLCDLFRSVKKSSLHQKILFLILTVIYILVMKDVIYYFLKAATSSSFVTSDNREYFYKASYFANHRTLDSICYVNGLADGSAVADHHFPSYVLYLGYAFMHTTAEQIVFPYHAAPLIAMFFQLPFLLAGAGAALCALAKKKIFLLLLPSLLFINKSFLDQIIGSTRDYFRFTILFVCIAVLYEFLFRGYTLEAKIPNVKLTFTAIICFLTASAHIVNFVAVCLILAAWVSWRLICALLIRQSKQGNNTISGNAKNKGKASKRRRKCSQHIPVPASRFGVKSFLIIFGVCFGSATLAFGGNIYYLIISGKWGAQRLDLSRYAFYPEYRRLLDAQSSVVPPYFARLNSSLELNYNSVSYIILFVLLLAIAWLAYRAAKSGAGIFFSLKLQPLIFTVLGCLFSFLPLSGLLDHPSLYMFSVYFASIPRYGLQFFIFGALLILIVLAGIVGWLFEKNKLSLNILGIAIACIAGGCMYKEDLKTIERYRLLFDPGGSYYMPCDEKFLNTFGELRAASHDIGDARLLIMPQLGYVFDGKNLQHMSPVAEPLYEAKNDYEMRTAFQKLGIKAAVLHQNANTSASLFPWYDYVIQHPGQALEGGYIVYRLE